MKYSVTQGSVFGPLLYIIFNNYLPANIRDECLEAYLFADDLAINIVHKNKNDIDLKLAEISDKIKNWCDANGLALNTNKTTSLNFSLNKSLSTSDIPVKFLGIYLEPGLGWKSQINYIENIISNGLFMLRVLKQNVSTDTLMTVYFAHIFTYLNYERVRPILEKIPSHLLQTFCNPDKRETNNIFCDINVPPRPTKCRNSDNDIAIYFTAYLIFLLFHFIYISIWFRIT